MSLQEHLNSDGQQFHQYKQRIITSHHNSLNTKRGTTIYDVGNPDPGLRHAHMCGGVN